MKGLSLRQPWAWFIIDGHKNIENTKWSTDYRGPLAIHASKNWDQDGFDFLYGKTGIWMPRREDYVFGALIGIVNLVDCVSAHDSEWFWGPWGFVLKNIRAFKNPIPWKGQLGLFEVPDRILREFWRGEL